MIEFLDEGRDTELSLSVVSFDVFSVAAVVEPEVLVTADLHSFPFSPIFS